MQIDPRLHQQWPDHAVLCWGLPYSREAYEGLVAAWHTDVGPPDEVEPHEMSDVVPGPEGFLVRVEHGSPGLLPWMLERVADQGLTVQRVHLVPDTTSVIPLVERRDALPSVVAWLVPRRSEEGGLRTVPASWLPRLAAHLDRGASPVLLILTRAYEGPVDTLTVPELLRRWVDVRTWVSVFDAGSAADFPVAVLGDTITGHQYVGIGVGGSDYLQDQQVTRAIAWAEQILVDVAADLDHGVVGVHLEAVHVHIGTAFLERQPSTGSAVHPALTVAAADRLVVDAGPAQVLGPGHSVIRRPGVEELGLAGGRRLVRVGQPGQWASTAGRDAMVALGRAALAPCLPSDDEFRRPDSPWGYR